MNKKIVAIIVVVVVVVIIVIIAKIAPYIWGPSFRFLR